MLRFLPVRGKGVVLPLLITIFILLHSATYVAAEEVSTSSELTQVQVKWGEVLHAIESDHLGVAADKLNELNSIKLALGYDSMDQHSRVLIGYGIRALNAKDLDKAHFFQRRALLLSPHSPSILIHSLWLARETGMSAVISQLMSAIYYSAYSPRVLLRVAEILTYPALWALTFGLYLVLLFSIALNVLPAIRMGVRFVPTAVRGIFGPPLVVMGLCLPAMMGPVWAVAIWGLYLRALAPQKRWAPFLSGVMVLLWGCIIPLKENLTVWLHDRHVTALLAEGSGDFLTSLQGDGALLSELATARTSDGVVLYAVGQAQFRKGEYEKAAKTLLRAEGIIGGPWTKATRGMVAIGNGALEAADKLFSEAEEDGLDTAQFYFNYSKLKFALSDTAKSREYLSRANAVDEEITRELETLDASLPTGTLRGYASIKLPWWVVSKSAFAVIPGLKNLYDNRAATVMKGVTPMGMLGVGALLLALSAWVTKGPRRVRGQSYYSGYSVPTLFLTVIRFFPGGSFVLAGRPLLGGLFASLAFLILFPLFGWPSGGYFTDEALDAFSPYYYVAAMLTVVVLIALGHYFNEEEEE